MSAPVKVLVFPCGTEIALEIHAALRWSTHVELYGSSSQESNHGAFVYRNYLEPLPFVDDPSFVERLNALIRGRGIDFIYPAHDSVLMVLADSSEVLACPVIGSPPETVRICRSKELTYDCFAGIVEAPCLYHSVEEVTAWPVFLKPAIGEGSRGVHIAKTPGEAEFYLGQDPSLLILEYLPGKEYTVDCFTDLDRRLRFVGVRERRRVTAGISVDASPVPLADKYTRFAETINDRLPFRGAWFFQLKENTSGIPSLLEIAPRIPGGMALHRNLGVNSALLSIFDAQGLPVVIQPLQHSIQMDRALTNSFKVDLEYHRVYLDLDDTLILRSGHVNPMMTAFVFQCIDRGKEVHLVTRHADDLDATLSRHRLSGLFDSIIHIQQGENKADHIQPTGAIFIDDSFSERERVRLRHGIPTFDPSMLESLLDWHY